MFIQIKKDDLFRIVHFGWMILTKCQIIHFTVVVVVVVEVEFMNVKRDLSTLLLDNCAGKLWGRGQVRTV